MKTKPKWVIFDVGQVLYDYKSFMKKVSVYLGVELPILKDILTDIIENSLRGEMTFKQVWQTTLKQIQKEHEFENIEKIWWNPDTFLKDTKLLVRQLYNSGYSIALFSNNWPGMRERILKNVSNDNNIIKHFFESSVEHIRKPDIEFYYLVEKRLGAKKSEIFFIDDKQINLETAKSLGWQTFLYEIGIDNGKTANNKIRKHLLKSD